MAIGLLLSTTLQACGPDQVASAGDVPIATPIVDIPSADLLACPIQAAPIPVDQAAVITAPVRRAMIGLATRYAAIVDQLTRLIQWNRPGSCPGQPRADPDAKAR